MGGARTIGENRRGVCMFKAGPRLARMGMGFVLIAAAIVGVQGVGWGWQGGTGDQARDAGIARLQEEIPGLMKEAEVPGMAVVVLREGKIRWAQNFGVKNAKSGAAVD